MKKSNEKYLNSFKTEMVTAYFCDYTRQIPRADLMKIEQIVSAEEGEDINTNLSCSSCILDLLRRCARIYFTDYPDELEPDLKQKFIPIKREKKDDKR